MILLCFGTRPEWLKIKPCIDALPTNTYQTLFTGQHQDLLRDINFDYAINIDQGTNRLDQIVSDCLLQFPDGDFDSILVQGDTASAFACALAAFHRNKKIIYLEAGLRTYDLEHPYPEEGYRQMIARLADINLCPTEYSKQNLVNEKVKGQIHVVGNTVLDNLLPYKSECLYTNVILVTIHRRENHPIIEEWFNNINALAIEHPELHFILPLHPNPNVQKHKHLLSHINVVDPLPYHDLLQILTQSKFVITDSGGLQEEGCFFNKKVIVCRKTTERPEGIDTGHLQMCVDPKDLKSLFDEINNNHNIESICPYGDGYASTRIKDILI